MQYEYKILGLAPPPSLKQTNKQKKQNPTTFKINNLQHIQICNFFNFFQEETPKTNVGFRNLQNADITPGISVQVFPSIIP